MSTPEIFELKNDQIEINFTGRGDICGIRSVREKQSFISPSDNRTSSAKIWNIELIDEHNRKHDVSNLVNCDFSYQHIHRHGKKELLMVWEKASPSDIECTFDVEVRITLQDSDPLAYWNMSVKTTP